MYDCGIAIKKDDIKIWRKKNLVEIDGKIYAKIGRTFATGVKCKVGDIIEVLVGRVREYVDPKTNEHYITWMFPKFRELRKEKKEPDTVDTARKLAKVGPEHIVLYEDMIKIELPKCSYHDNLEVCPLRIRFRGLELSNIAIQYLRFPIACPLASIFRCIYIKDYYYDWKVYRRVKL